LYLFRDYSCTFPRPIIISADVLFHALPLESLKVFHPNWKELKYKHKISNELFKKSIVGVQNLLNGNVFNNSESNAVFLSDAKFFESSNSSAALTSITNKFESLSSPPSSNLLTSLSPIRCICREFSLHLLYHRICIWEKRCDSSSTTSEFSDSNPSHRKLITIIGDPHDEDMPSLIQFPPPSQLKAVCTTPPLLSSFGEEGGIVRKERISNLLGEIYCKDGYDIATLSLEEQEQAEEQTLKKKLDKEENEKKEKEKEGKKKKGKGKEKEKEKEIDIVSRNEGKDGKEAVKVKKIKEVSSVEGNLEKGISPSKSTSIYAMPEKNGFIVIMLL
jgi:hypothetical protein